jgi:Zn-finger nucleic acid-binding protein
MDDEVDTIGDAHKMPSKLSCPKCINSSLISTSFGDSKIFIDWCSKCNGLWLDRDEFHHILTFLNNKLDTLSSDEVKKTVYQEIKEIWSGPENKVSEILDAKAAISALINITIFEHPKLHDSLRQFSRMNPIR